MTRTADVPVTSRRGRPVSHGAALVFESGFAWKLRPVSMLTLPSPYGKSVVFPLGLGQPAAALRPSLPRRQGSGILRSMSVLMPPSDKGPLFAHPYSQLPEPVLAPARPQPPAPDETCCTALWEKYAMPPHIRRHCKVVAHIACTLAGRALARGFEVDVAQVRAAGLLHDLAKAYSIHYGAGHAHLGASWVVAETRHHAVAQGVMLHVHWPWRIPVDDGARLCTLPFLRFRFPSVGAADDSCSAALFHPVCRQAHPARPVRHAGRALCRSAGTLRTYRGRPGGHTGLPPAGTYHRTRLRGAFGVLTT